MTDDEKAKKIIEILFNNLCDRSGTGNAFDEIDSKTKDEIFQELVEEVKTVLANAK